MTMVMRPDVCVGASCPKGDCWSVQGGDDDRIG